MIDSMKIVEHILNYKKLPQIETDDPARTIRSFDKGSYTVLPSSKTRLIGCFLSLKAARLFTVDIDCLIR